MEMIGKAVALKRWEQLNPDRLSYHVMFANTALHDDGKKTVRDFILGMGQAASEVSAPNGGPVFDLLASLPTDFMREGRDDPQPQEREFF